MTQQYCYIHVRGQRPGARIGIAKYLDSGYYPCDKDYDLPDAEQVDMHIDALNAVRGISPKVREGMEAGSMFGWRCPAAIPALKHFGAPEIDPQEEAKLHG
jgi:hypothetical protein